MVTLSHFPALSDHRSPEGSVLPKAQSTANSQTRNRLSSARWLRWVFLCLLAVPAGAASGLVHFDFEQRYFVHPHRQVWDFSIVRPDSVYHIFYHTIHEETPNAAYADTIWHATSEDLKHWNIEGPVLTVGQGSWDAGALWAPDVFFDHLSNRWTMAYTACDIQMNQRIALASSDDLYSWTKSAANPILEPDPAIYQWTADAWWSNFRDPFVFVQDGIFHVLVTAKQFLDRSTGVLFHAVSMDLANWIDIGPIFVNDGIDPWRVLESPQYRLMDGKYYLLFGEYDTIGISAIWADLPGGFTMDSRHWIDYGYAPEVDEFTPGVRLFSRIAPFDSPATGLRSYVVRLDTLAVEEDGAIHAYQPHPLADNWRTWTGAANLAQPTFGDNPTLRGEESVGLVGNGYYGSREYFQGPLSGRGGPGSQLGDAAVGELSSQEFTITGSRMTLLVGGGDFPETCFVALMDANADTAIYSETGGGQERMTLRQWDLTPYQGWPAYIQISDRESQAGGHINVDEIHEDYLALSPAGQVPPEAARLNTRAVPNPFNPSTSIRFELDRPGDLTLRIHDLRGRLIWSSGRLRGQIGPNEVTWNGVTRDGNAAPAGTYLFTLERDGVSASSGKICLVK